MTEIEGNLAGRVEAAVPRELAIDLGLRRYMLQVYNFMGLSVLLTAVVAYATYALSVTTDPAAAALVNGQAARAGDVYLTAFGARFFGGPWVAVAMFAPIVAIILLYVSVWLSRGVVVTGILFFSIPVMFGLGLSTILFAYTEASIVKVFFVTAASFGALSLYGYTTRSDLNGLGAFMLMGLAGLVIAGLVNLLFRSSMMDFVISVCGVVVFAGLTAYDTQKIKERYVANDDGSLTRTAMLGALDLYLDFINLFLYLLKLLGELKKITD